jgi:hypothetical protein
MFKRKQIVLYGLLAGILALGTSVALADHASCVAACAQTLVTDMELATAASAVVAAICCAGCFIWTAGVGCALCVAGAAAGLSFALAQLANDAQACMSACPQDPPPPVG